MPENLTETDWLGMMRVYYGMKITQVDAEHWRDQITGRNGIRGVDDELVAEVINDHRMDKSKRWPNADRLRTWIFMKLKENRGGYEVRDEPESCAMCYRGWVTAWPEEPIDITSIPVIPTSSLQTPCDCAAGSKVYDVAYGKASNQHRESIRKQAQRAIKQRQSILSAVTKADMMAGGLAETVGA